VQFQALEAQLEMADRLGKPVVFHSRSATGDLLDVLANRRPAPWLLHCFSGTEDEAVRACEMGCLLGVDGPVTYPKAEDLRETLRCVGLDRLVIETDSPYLAPHPHRGKPNRPALLPLVAQGLARALGVGDQEVALRTTENARRFFGILPPECG
jgi:TatD DNase family protein